ncbi:MAG: response regulator transcription factor [Acidobacteria bacterium]|nr:response regulator transcription factor [Acidobacteriota bacterium]
MIHVLAYVDEPVLAQGLHDLLRWECDIEARIVSTLSALWSAISVEPPDLLLLNLTPAVTIQTIQNIAEMADGTRIVLWLRNIDPALGAQAIRAGVCGILRKTLPPEMLLKCLRKVSDGELWVEKPLAKYLIEGKTPRLTGRELELLTALAHGLRNKEIAALLQLTEASAKIYVFRLQKKLKLKDRFELCLYGLKHTGCLFMEQSAEATEDSAFSDIVSQKPPRKELNLVKSIAASA